MFTGHNGGRYLMTLKKVAEIPVELSRQSFVPPNAVQSIPLQLINMAGAIN